MSIIYILNIFAMLMFLVSFHKISKPSPTEGTFLNLTPTPLVITLLLFDTLQGSDMKQSIL